MNRLKDGLVLFALGLYLLLCVGAAAFCGLVFWWLAYAGMVIGNGGLFVAFCLLMCGTCVYALVRLLVVIGAGMKLATDTCEHLAGGPGL